MDCWGVGKHSITRQFIQRVFALYCFVAIAVTAIQMTVEYTHAKHTIFDELATNENIFGPVLAQSLWDLDREQMHSVLQGMLTIPAVVGVSLEQNNTVLASVGKTASIESIENNHLQRSNANSSSELVHHDSDDTFSVVFPVVLDYQGEKRVIGQTRVYSDSSVIINRVGVGFIVLVINAVIKTIALWFIFLWIGKKLLNRPLTDLTEAISSINFDNLESFHCDLKQSKKNELSVIEETFSNMIAKLNGAKLALLDFNRDLDKRVSERTQELELAKTEAEQANKSKTQFLSRMSHELRTPLNAIIGFSKRQEKLFSKRIEAGDIYNGDERLLEMSSMVNKSGQHLLMLITDIMSFVQSEQGTININLQRCSLLDVISDSAIMVGPLADKHNIKVTFSCGNYCVWADKGRLMQVIINLMSNAIKYNRHEGSVVVSATKMPDEILLHVTDTGVGVPDEDKAAIFEPFVRLSHAENNAIDGTGIGLALSQYLMSKMNGSIDLLSEVDKGSTFTLHLQECRQECRGEVLENENP